MRILVAEDDFVSRKILQVILSPYGICDIAVDGEEAIQAFKVAFEEGELYDLVCLDIMMPGADGQEVLKTIRGIEKENGIGGLDGAKVLMVTALNDGDNIMRAFREQCEGYITKPVDKQRLLGQLRELKLI